MAGDANNADSPSPRERGEGGPQGRMRGSAEGSSLFRKNTLDEMTVGRTEVPLRKSHVERSEAQDLRQSNNAGRAPAKPADLEPRRFKSGAGSYEDANDLKRQKRRPGKTGRPGR